MPNTATNVRLTGLQAAILRTIAYSDLFDFPLTPDEIVRWLPVSSSREDVVEALKEGPLASLVGLESPYVTLAGRESLVAVRNRRAHSSASLLRTAWRVGGLIGHLPFVRMVAITGALAVENSDDGDDLDYLIVTTPGRVWLTRTMIMAIGRVAALRSITLCPNYLLSETALALLERDFYTARELLQMRPVAGHATYERMLSENAWWQDFLPNATPRPAPSPPFPPAGRGLGGGVSLVRRIVEVALRLPPFDALERWIMGRKVAELRAQSGSPEAVFDETMCKGHFDAWKQRTERHLEDRLGELSRKLQDSSCSSDNYDAPVATDPKLQDSSCSRDNYHAEGDSNTQETSP